MTYVAPVVIVLGSGAVEFGFRAIGVSISDTEYQFDVPNRIENDVSLFSG